MNERTYIMVKPSGVQRGLIGEIIKRFEQKGLRLIGIKIFQANEELMKQHYRELSGRNFFPGLITYLCSSPVCGMVWSGPNAVRTGRELIGETNKGSIRGDYCVQTGVDVIHGSDTVAEAEREISLWFRPNEIVNFQPAFSF